MGRASHPTHKPTPTPTLTPTPSPTPLHQVSQHGDPPAFCHKQSLSCWGPASGLRDLEKTLLKRKSNAPPGSYTARLFGDADLLRKKLVEEAQVCSRTSHLAPRTSPLAPRRSPLASLLTTPRHPPVTPPSPPPSPPVAQELAEATEPDHAAAEAADLFYFGMVKLVAAGASLAMVRCAAAT